MSVPPPVMSSEVELSLSEIEGHPDEAALHQAMWPPEAMEAIIFTLMHDQVI